MFEGASKDTTHTVAFLGPAASYSHQISFYLLKATRIAFPGTFGQSYTPVASIRDVFDAVQDGRATRGVVPFENSTHGTVSFTLDALADRKGELKDVVVCGEVYLSVVHCLLGKQAVTSEEDADTPVKDVETSEGQPQEGTDPAFAHIRRIYSHPQGFGQTGAILKSRLRHAELIDVSSTSKAAEMAADDKSGQSAAIASELAGETYAARGLEVLVKGVQDRDDNVTRFFIIRKGSPAPKEEAGKMKWKSLASFTVPHGQPGALADVLGCFRKCELNLTSINSLPSLVKPFQYLFFVECEGKMFMGVDERVFGELARVAQTWRWLGCWEDQRS